MEKIKKVNAFKDAIHKICKEHGFCIEHEDFHGAFIIEKYKSSKDFEWFDAAQIGESIDYP